MSTTDYNSIKDAASALEQQKLLRGCQNHHANPCSPHVRTQLLLRPAFAAHALCPPASIASGVAAVWVFKACKCNMFAEVACSVAFIRVPASTFLRWLVSSSGQSAHFSACKTLIFRASCCWGLLALCCLPAANIVCMQLTGVLYVTPQSCTSFAQTCIIWIVDLFAHRSSMMMLCCLHQAAYPC